MKFCPEIIKTKEINKQKDLKAIRDKFESNELLNEYECSLVIAFPIFELDEREDAVVEEMCNNLCEKQFCIPEDERDKLVVGMYLNIVEYIDPEKQNELLEKIKMEAKSKGVIASLIDIGRKEGMREGEREGKREGERNIISQLLKTCSVDEISVMIDKKPAEIYEILDSD